MNIWLTSDNHFWHANVILYCNRPFASEEEFAARKVSQESVQKMNEIMIKNWNSVVMPGDRVIHIGDFAMAIRAVETIRPRLNGDIDLYMGNHDWPHPAHKKGRNPELREKWTNEYLKYGFKSVQIEGTLDVPGVANFRLCHLPYRNGDEGDTHQNGQPRHFKERPIDDGTPLLCGHVHERFLVKTTQKGTIQINVGVDAPGAPWSGLWRPASLEEVVKVYLDYAKTQQ